MENASVHNGILIQDDEYIAASTINARMRELLLADTEMAIVNNIRPDVWTARWEYSNGKPYMAGEAVWLNTETEYEFINSHCDEMYQYAVNNSLLKRIVVPYVNNDPQIYQIYRQMLSGYFDCVSGVQLPPMYWLGKITEPVQLRICIQDGTTTLPTDTCAWQDFFVGEENNKELLLNEFSAQVSSSFSKHVTDYHLSGVAYNLNEVYALNDFSNIDQNCIQRFLRHNVHTDLSGFAYVKRFELSDYCKDVPYYKWYRLWSNGYLEQGGRVVLNRVKDISDKTNDVILPNNIGVSVRLIKKYDYPTAGINQQYDMVQFLLSNDISISSLNDIKRHNRYIVQVTRENDMLNTDIPIQTTGFKNVSFDVILQPNGSSVPLNGVFSYYCSGFTNSNSFG